MEPKNKNSVEVIINGEVITLMGVESEEYIQKIARYIDKKVSTLLREKKSLGTNAFMKTLLVSVNIADDLFKEREKVQLLDAELAKYMDEMGKMQEENFLLTEKIKEMQMQLFSAKRELDEYIEVFDQQESTDKSPIKFRK